MTIIQIILLVLACISVAGYVLSIAGLSNRLPLMEKIAKPFILPPLLAILIIILTPYLPDARNIMRNAVPAVSFGLIAIILFDYLKSVRYSLIFRTITIVMLCVQKIFWHILLYRSLQLYPRMRAFTVCMIIFYILLTVFLFILKIYPAKFFIAILFVINMAASCLVNYETLVTLAGNTSIYSVLFFAGSIAMLGGDYFLMIDFSEKNFEGIKLIKDILFFAGQILMALAAISMMLF